MNNFKPFENDTQNISIGPQNAVTVENGIDTIVIYGDYEINKETNPQEIDDLINLLKEIKSKLPKKENKATLTK